MNFFTLLEIKSFDLEFCVQLSGTPKVVPKLNPKPRSNDLIPNRVQKSFNSLLDILAKYEWSLLILKILKVTFKLFLLLLPLFSYSLFSFSFPP